MEEDSDGFINSQHQYYAPYNYNSPVRNGEMPYATPYQMPVYQEYTPYYQEYEAYSPTRVPQSNGFTGSRLMPNPSATEYVPDSYQPQSPEPVVEQEPEETHDESPFALHHITQEKFNTEELDLETSALSLVSPVETRGLLYTELPEFSLPPVYFCWKPILKVSLLANFKETTLFYMFYGIPNETCQAEAAQELYRRNWKFCTDDASWYQFKEQLTFDINSWEIERSEQLPIGRFLTSEEVKVRKV